MTDAERALRRAAEAQAAYWEALGALEGELGIEIDETIDLEDRTVESLLNQTDEEEEDHE